MIMNFDTIIQYPLGILLGLLAFIVLFIPAVCIHEFGHLIVARICGVRVPEYAIGMPFSKRLFWFRKFGIVWSFYPILLGGFVRLFGDNDALDNAQDLHKTDKQQARIQYIQDRFEEIVATKMLQFFVEDNNIEWDSNWQLLEDFNYSKGELSPELARLKKQAETLIDWELDRELVAKDTLFSKNWFQETAIILGGITFNFITAIICFALIFNFSIGGKSSVALSQIGELSKRANIQSVSEYANFTARKNGVAEKNGIITGDKLYSIGGIKMKDFQDTTKLYQFLQTKKDQDVQITFAKKDSDTIQSKIVRLEQLNGEVLFGIQGMLLHDVQYQSKGIFESLSFGFDKTREATEFNFTALGRIGTALLPQTQDRSALNQLGGPVGASNQIVDIFSRLKSDQWLSAYLQILASISISLAVFNLLPIPALDGGRWVILTLTKILGRRNRRLEGIVVGWTFLALMALGILIILKDSWGIITKPIMK